MQMVAPAIAFFILTIIFMNYYLHVVDVVDVVVLFLLMLFCRQQVLTMVLREIKSQASSSLTHGLWMVAISSHHYLSNMFKGMHNRCKFFFGTIN